MNRNKQVNNDNNIMTRIFFFSILIFMTLLVSCNRHATNEKNFIQDSVPSGKGDLAKSDFDKFKSKFKQLDIKNLSSLASFLNTYLISSDKCFDLVESNFKKAYLQGVDTSLIYYGYKTELPNNGSILTFLNHCSTKTSIDDPEVIDTTFVTMVFYNASGNILGNLRLFGSNLTGTPPTYNMISRFQSKKDGLVICSYEYSTGNNYNDVVHSNKDSIYKASLTSTSFYIDYHTNKIILVNKKKQKAEVIESSYESGLVYLKPR